jgi:diguanylate cyclase (GGDEF)-like protein/PAS domain S-box-containing protein
MLAPKVHRRRADESKMTWAATAKKWLRPESLGLAFDTTRRLRTQRLLTVAGVLFVAIFALRFAVGGVDELVLLLCVVPIALVAIALGAVGGLAAATLSYAVFVAWVVITHTDVNIFDHLARGLSFYFVGGLVGYYTATGWRLEARAARWFELSLDMAATAGFDGYFKQINPTFGKTLGYTTEELLQEPFLSFVHPEDLEATEQAAAGLGQGTNVVGFTNRYRAKDGTYKWLEWASTSVISDQLIYASVKDVTDKKMAEKKLLEAEERFRTAFESAPIGMGLVGMEGNWLQANGALCRLTGYSSEEILRVGFDDITHPDDRPADAEHIERLRSGEIDSYRLEKRFIHHQGYPVWVSFNASLVRLPGGPPLYLITQVEDIGKRKELEEQLRHLAQHDSLTELFNRRRFDEELTRQFAHAHRYHTKGALLILDLDNFKEVNDSRGHAAGDDVLRKVGNILRKQLRTTDIAARLGGDEFAVILAEGDSVAATNVAKKLLAAVRGGVKVQKAPVPIRLSIGIALMGATGASDQESLMHQADASMYRSKKAGGDQYSFFSELDSAQSLLGASKAS